MTSKPKLSPWNLTLGLLLLAASLSGCAPAQESAAVPAPEQQDGVVYADLLPNGLEPTPGLVVGGQPTRDQLDEAAARGIKTVINLRTESESDIGREDVEARGMTYVAIPIGGAKDLTAANAAALDAALAATESPVMVHCASGNRVGALFALRAHYVQGASVEDAMAFGKEAGMTRLGEAVSEVLSASEEATQPNS